MPPVHKGCRHSKFSQSPIIKIDALTRTQLRKLQPHPAIVLDNRLPLLPMIGGKQASELLADLLRMMRIALKEIVRTGLVAVEVKRLENKLFATVRSKQSNLGSDHRPIAVSPERGPLDPQRIENKQSLLRRPPMKIDRSLPRQARRLPVARPVRNHKTRSPRQFLNLPVDGINPITPAAMQKNEQWSAPHISIVNGNWPNPSRMRRFFQFHKRHRQSVRKVAPPSRRLSGGRLRPPRRGRDALRTQPARCRRY